MVTTISSPALQESTKTYDWDVCGIRIHIEVHPTGEIFVNGKHVNLAHEVRREEMKQLR